MANPYTSAQAPQSMQIIAPDLAAQQLQLARQQQMADMLREQSMKQDNGTEMVSGWAVKKSPIQGLNTIAQALMGGYMQKNADEKQLAIAKLMQGRTAEMFGAGENSPPAAPTQVGPNVAPMDMNNMTEGGSNAMPSPAVTQGAPSAPAQPSAGVPQPQQRNMTLNGMSPQEAMRAYALDPNGYMASYLKQFEATDLSKNDRYLGISADQSRQAELAKRLKEGTMSLQPGQTNVMPDGSRMVAPNFETGVAGGFDATGNPVAREIAGSTQIAANRAGAVAGATSGANAQNEMVTVNIGGRPVMMTKAQAVQLSNGGAPQAGVQFNNPNPNGLSLDFKGGPQETFDKIAQIKDPVMRAQAMEALKQMPAQAPGGVGIAGETAAENEKEVGQVRNALAIEKSRIENAQSPEQQQKLIDAQGVMGLLDAAEPLLTSGVPTASSGGVLRDKITGAMGISTEASQASARLSAIGGALVSKQPKMSGPQSDKDVAQYKEMAGRIGDPTVPLGDRQAALQTIRDLTQKYLSQNQGSIANQALTRNTGIPAQVVPKVTPPVQPPKKMEFKYLGKE